MNDLPSRPSGDAIRRATPDPDEVATAYHEAGHAVMALVLGRPVLQVSVRPNLQRLGQCKLGKGTFQPSKDSLETEILILLGGLAAEARHRERYCWQGASRDLRSVRALAEMRAGTPARIERLERRMLDKAEHILNQPAVWLAVTRIADELLRSTTISGRAARHLFDRSSAEIGDES